MRRSKTVKPLSSEMDPAEIRLTRKVVIKERRRRFFEKNQPVPNSLRALQSYSAISYSNWQLGT
jgi:hypothetical protein